MTGRTNQKQFYREAITKQIESDFEITASKRAAIEALINKSDVEELARIYEAFERFGAKCVMDVIVDGK